MANLTPKNFAFNNVVVTYDAVRIEGFADQGDAIQWAPNGEAITSTMGPDGELAINKQVEKPARLTLRLMATSESVGYLSALANIQRQPGYAGPYPACSIVDGNTGSVWTSPAAWVVQQPSTSFGTEVGSVEFVIEGKWVVSLKGVS